MNVQRLGICVLLLQIGVASLAFAADKGLQGTVLKLVDPEHVEISLGADDGLEKDHRLEVFDIKRRAFVGKIQVTKLGADQSTAQILKRFSKSEVKAGHSVYVRIQVDLKPGDPPLVDGLVTEVSKKNTRLIEISLGADDGIREGHQLTVYRKKMFLATVVVRRTTSNRSVAEAIKQTQQGVIQKGDNVTTKVN